MRGWTPLAATSPSVTVQLKDLGFNLANVRSLEFRIESTAGATPPSCGLLAEPILVK